MIRKIRSSRAVPLVGLAAGVALILAGCGGDGNGSTDPTTTPGDDTTTEPGGEIEITRALRVWAGSEPPIVANFNPFSPAVLHAALGPIYETLFYYNQAGSEDPRPVVGESFTWNEEGTELTVSIKSGLLWSDGEPLTSEDVAFTFTYSPNERAYIEDAVATDDTTVVITFNGPQFTNEFSVLGSTWILPKHVWENVDDPVNVPNEDPVGSGPYVVDAVSESSYTIVGNENFRDYDTLAVREVIYVAVAGNQQGADLFVANQIDYAGMFLPDANIVTSTGRIDGINTPQDPTVLYTCSNADLGCEGAQTDVAVRQALNLAIDRGSINERAFFGHAGNASPTFTLPGRDDHWLADGAPAESPQSADPEAARAILEDAGYTEGSDGIYAKDGVRVSMDLMSVDGWTDYNDAARLIEEQALAAGIEVTPLYVSWNEFADGRAAGNYELIMGGLIGTSVPDPFQIYRDWLTTEYTDPVGTQLAPGNWNIARYSNPIVDEAVANAAQTNDEATKKDEYAKIQEEILRDLPYIPIVINATQTWWDIQDFQGWPTQENPYAFPPPWRAGAAGQVLVNLRAAD